MPVSITATLTPCTREAELVLGDVRARHLDRRDEIRSRRRRRLRDRDGVDRIDRLDVRQRQRLLELPCADLDREAVPELLELVAGLVRDPRLLRVGMELLPLRCQGRGVTAVGGRVPGQLDEPGAEHVLGHLAVADVGRRADLPVSAPAMATGTSKAANTPSSASKRLCGTGVLRIAFSPLRSWLPSRRSSSRVRNGRILVATPGCDKRSRAARPAGGPASKLSRESRRSAG